MRLANCMLLFVMAAVTALGADPKWITMQNENFLMYSSANARDTRDALNYFERIRSFFLQRMGAPPAKPVPILIIMFNSEKEYEPYRFNEVAIAYYAGSNDRDYIVMGKTGEQTARAAAHEYTHLVFKHAGYTLPPWINEGIAELFGTMRPLGGDTEYGDIIPGRLQALTMQPWVPLQTILAADQDSPYYNEKQRAGNLYNEGWALVQFLSTTDDYRPKFWELVKTIQSGVASRDALEKVYGKPLAKIENDLQFHIRSDNFKKLLVKGVRVDDMGKLAAQPANLYDVRIAQADLLAGIPKTREEAKKRYADLTREDAKRAEPWSALGYLAWRENRREEALANFAKAFELGDRTERFLWDYGRMEEPEDSQKALTILTTLTKLQPQHLDARIEVGGMLLNLRKPGEAVAAVADIQKVKNQNQLERLLYLTGSAYAQLGELQEARARAEQLKQQATAAEFTKRAEVLLSYVARVEESNARKLAAPPPPLMAVMAAVAPPENSADEGGAPSLRPTVRRDEPRETHEATRADLEMILQDAGGK
ncbi:MAG: hypothetical protein ABI995_03650, partial [Acidobacteriota bacterium]